MQVRGRFIKSLLRESTSVEAGTGRFIKSTKIRYDKINLLFALTGICSTSDGESTSVEEGTRKVHKVSTT